MVLDNKWKEADRAGRGANRLVLNNGQLQRLLSAQPLPYSLPLVFMMSLQGDTATASIIMRGARRRSVHALRGANLR